MEVNRIRYNSLNKKSKKVKVLVDTSFVIGIAQRIVKDISSIEVEIGKMEFFIPNVVLNELKLIASNKNKRGQLARLALEIAKNWNIFDAKCRLSNVDEVIEKAAKEEGFIVATLDSKLRKKLISNGIQVITLRQKSRLILLP